MPETEGTLMARFRLERATVTVAAAMLVAIAAWIGSCVLRDRALGEGFLRVSAGMSESDVVGIIGDPKQITGCVGEFAPHEHPDCTKTYVYASAWAPLNPYYPVVWFGRDGRVIDKYPFASP